jgi:hypothetical protein
MTDPALSSEQRAQRNGDRGFSLDLHEVQRTTIEISRELLNIEFYRHHMPKRDVQSRIRRAQELVQTLQTRLNAFAVAEYT